MGCLLVDCLVRRHSFALVLGIVCFQMGGYKDLVLPPTRAEMELEDGAIHRRRQSCGEAPGKLTA